MNTDKYYGAIFDMIEELASDKKNQIKFSADKDGIHREYVLISPDTNEKIFTIKFRAATERLPYRCDLYINGENVNLPQKSIYAVMEIMRKRSVAEKEATKLVKAHTDQSATLKFLERFQPRQ